jgi:OOP family OmpA-OmpF porin
VPTPVLPAPVITAPSIPAPVVPPPAVPGLEGLNITLENGRQGILNSIYFEPDTDVLIETYRPILESVGRQLAADPGFKLLIRAYAADFGTSDGRYLVSVSRARFTRDFLTGKYGISSSRFSSEAYGADKTPIYATADWQSHRCVELILFKE